MNLIREGIDGRQAQELVKERKGHEGSADYVSGCMATTTREEGKGWMTLSAVRGSHRQSIAITITWSFLMACEQRRCDVTAQPP